MQIFIEKFVPEYGFIFKPGLRPLDESLAFIDLADPTSPTSNLRFDIFFSYLCSTQSTIKQSKIVFQFTRALCFEFSASPGFHPRLGKSSRKFTKQAKFLSSCLRRSCSVFVIKNVNSFQLKTAFGSPARNWMVSQKWRLARKSCSAMNYFLCSILNKLKMKTLGKNCICGTKINSQLFKLWCPFPKNCGLSPFCLEKIPADFGSFLPSYQVSVC